MTIPNGFNLTSSVRRKNDLDLTIWQRIGLFSPPSRMPTTEATKESGEPRSVCVCQGLEPLDRSQSSPHAPLKSPATAGGSK
jgi:hypothetical protein